MINTTDKSKLIATEQQAHLKGDLKFFLKPFFTFRLYVKFKKDKRVCHFYGNEHECTYKQLLHGQVPSIKLSRTKGYTDLIKLVEHTWKDKLLSATIYMRTGDDDRFNTICRRWYNGDWEEIQDPVIDAADDTRILFYHFEKNRLQLSSEDPNKIDFKTELTNALTKNTGASSPDK